jgi:hypothetical protein
MPLSHFLFVLADTAGNMEAFDKAIQVKMPRDVCAFDAACGFSDDWSKNVGPVGYKYGRVLGRLTRSLRKDSFVRNAADGLKSDTGSSNRRIWLL